MRRMYSLEQLKNIANIQIKELVEGGTLANAKPIYCHAITIVLSSGGERFGKLTCLLFDNNSNVYDKSGFLSRLQVIANMTATEFIQLLVSGAIISEGTEHPATFLENVKDSDNFTIYYGVSGSTQFTKSDLSSAIEVFIDAVNKIN